MNTGVGSSPNVGGVYMTGNGSVICQGSSCGGNILMQGSSIYGASGLSPNTAVALQAGSSITTGGSISLLEGLNQSGVIQLRGNLQTKGLNSTVTLSPSTTLGSGTINLGANISTNNGTVSFNAPVSLIAAATINTTNPGGTASTGTAVSFNYSLSGSGAIL